MAITTTNTNAGWPGLNRSDAAFRQARWHSVAGRQGLCRGFGTSGGLAQSQLKMPSSAFHIIDANNAGGGWWRGFREADSSCSADQYHKMYHDDRVNIAFADGHSASAKATRAYPTTYSTYSSKLPWYAPGTSVDSGW